MKKITRTEEEIYLDDQAEYLSKVNEYNNQTYTEDVQPYETIENQENEEF